VVREDGRVRHVVVEGRVVVEDGRLVAADMNSIAEASGREANRLWQKMAAIHD
jgi:hypothetical protein